MIAKLIKAIIIEPSGKVGEQLIEDVSTQERLCMKMRGKQRILALELKSGDEVYALVDKTKPHEGLWISESMFKMNPAFIPLKEILNQFTKIR